MSSKPLPKEMSEDQIKFWTSNTELTKEEVIVWYKSFQEHSLKKNGLDKAEFVKFFDDLKHTKKSNQDLYTIMFDGKILKIFILFISLIKFMIKSFRQRLVWNNW